MTGPAFSMGRRPRRNDGRAFTLIEVLVVVAIMALLIAILLPSLRAARDEAKVVSCQANCKQISNIMAIYQAEFRGYLPVMFNYYSITYPNSEAPARLSLMSLAFRMYDQKTRNLKHKPVTGMPGKTFDPDAHWRYGNDADTVLLEYNAKYLPDYYVCPFERDRRPGSKAQRVSIGATIKINNTEFELAEFQGRQDNYHTWIRENIVRGQKQSGYSGRSDDFVVKDTVMTWNRVLTSGEFPDGTAIPPISDAVDIFKDDPQRTITGNAHRKWTTTRARALRCSLSTASVAFCGEGENMGEGRLINNLGSHRRNGRGGTNVIYADGHVGYTKGTRIGF